MKGVEEYFIIFGEPWITICKSFLNCGEYFGRLSVIQVTSSTSLVNYQPLCFNLGKNHFWWFEQKYIPWGKSRFAHWSEPQLYDVNDSITLLNLRVFLFVLCLDSSVSLFNVLLISYCRLIIMVQVSIRTGLFSAEWDPPVWIITVW